MTKTNKFFLSALTAVMILLPLSSQAAETWPSVSEMWTMVPKADQGDEFFKGLKEHMEFRSENGDPWVWKTYTPMMGDDVNLVAVRVCCFNWADADTYREWSEANPQVVEHFNKHVGAHVEKYGHHYSEVSWANSNIKSEWGPYRYFAVTEFTVKPGRRGEFDESRDAISQISLNQGWATEDRPWMWARSVGGESSESIVIPMKNMADMDRDDQNFFNFMSKVMGSDEAADELFGKLAATVATRDFQIWQLHEDLSMKDKD